jgi:hypothetical protein
MFFVAYVICEIPSNLIMLRVGSRKWIARIMVAWALLTAAMSVVHSAESFYEVFDRRGRGGLLSGRHSLSNALVSGQTA